MNVHLLTSRHPVLPADTATDLPDRCGYASTPSTDILDESRAVNRGVFISSQVYCVARFEAKPGEELAVFRALRQFEPHSHREDGCILYTVTRSRGSKDDVRDASGFHFAFLEIWADEECFEAHCRRQEIAGFFAREIEDAAGRIARTQVDIYSDEPFDFDAPEFLE